MVELFKRYTSGKIKKSTKMRIQEATVIKEFDKNVDI